MDNVVDLIKSWLLPELSGLKTTMVQISARQDEMSQRLSDISQQLVAVNARIDEQGKEIRAEIKDLRVELRSEMSELTRRLDSQIGSLTLRLESEISSLTHRVDGLNARVDRWFESAVNQKDFDDLREEIRRIKAHLSL